MDEAVRAALRKWPDVPDVYGWLALDLRGRFRLRTGDQTPARFDTIGNEALVAFIGRNYQPDARGRWFFQNGPQRVFVQLALTPWVFRLHPGDPPATHTGIAARAIEALVFDEHAAPVLLTDLGPGLVDDRDQAAILEHLADTMGRPVDDTSFDAWLATPAGPLLRWTWQEKAYPVLAMARASLPARMGFDPDPRPDD